MHSIVFYSPNEYHHPSSNDSDIWFSTDLQDFDQAVSASDHPQPIVCLCCADPSTIINTLQPNVLIYLCTFHSGRVNLPNVREDVVFNADGDWKFKIVLNRIQLTGLNGNQGALRVDLRILREIADQSYVELQPSVENQNQNSSPETSDRDLQGEETEEKKV